MDITEAELVFRGTLKRTTEADFVGSDGRVQVTFSSNSGRVQVVNAVTKTPFDDYKIAPIFLGEDPKTMCDPKKEPC